MNVGVQEAVVRKENQVLLVTLGTQDRLAHRGLKETLDQQGQQVAKGKRVSKDNQASQDHPVHRVLQARAEGKACRGSKVKKVTMVRKDLRDQQDLRALQALQD